MSATSALNTQRSSPGSPRQSVGIQRLDAASKVSFTLPKKMIHEGHDVQQFLASKAYTDIVTFLLQLDNALLPRQAESSILTYPIKSGEKFSSPVENLRKLLADLEILLDEAPPDPGPRRFGNVSFRRWYTLVQGRLDGLLERVFDGSPVLEFAPNIHDSASGPLLEVKEYLLGSWGSPQRLDYGTGHELSFLAFLGCLWKLNYFPVDENENVERQVAIGVFEPYLQLIRKIIKMYNLEPAGSRGVWGLDDHSFIPYILGSAQLSKPVSSDGIVSTEGSLSGAPPPTSVAKAAVVEQYRESNFYFQAIGFINDVKSGPFWEHSPTLWDISGVQAGWAKINKGMIKMYIAEVLSKFPVVQHFPFGALFQWERDPHAAVPLTQMTPSPQNQSLGTFPQTTTTQLRNVPPQPRPGDQLGTTQAPWASGTKAASTMPATAAPWAHKPGQNLPTTIPSNAGRTSLRPMPTNQSRSSGIQGASAGAAPPTGAQEVEKATNEQE